MAPGIRYTFRTCFSNGIGRANALTSLWITIITQMGTVTSFTGEKAKKKKKDESKSLIQNIEFYIVIYVVLFSVL